MYNDLTYMPTRCKKDWVSSIRFVNTTMAEIIKEKRLPGLYILRENGKFIGIDAHTGEVHTEEFSSKLKCIDWLIDSVRADAKTNPPLQFPEKARVDQIRHAYPAGCRVELVRMDDVQAPPIGTKGTVTGVDDIGSIMVHWDNGSSLHVVYGTDECRKLNC